MNDWEVRSKARLRTALMSTPKASRDFGFYDCNIGSAEMRMSICGL